MKSKSVTNLAEATADPALELDAGGNPINPPTPEVARQDEGAVGPAPVAVQQNEVVPGEQH